MAQIAPPGSMLALAILVAAAILLDFGDGVGGRGSALSH